MTGITRRQLFVSLGGFIASALLPAIGKFSVDAPITFSNPEAARLFMWGSREPFPGAVVKNWSFEIVGYTEALLFGNPKPIYLQQGDTVEIEEWV